MIGRCLPTVLVAVLVFAVFGIAHGQQTEVLAQADGLWAQRADLGKCRQAVALYEQVLAGDPNNYEAAWKLARACYWLGENSPEAEKIPVFEKGIEAAKKAATLKDDQPAGHFWLGVSYGKYGEAKGVLKSLALVDPSKEAMNRVIELDPKFEYGGAYRVLGRIYYKLPGLMGGSNKKALEYLQKAVEIGPDRLLNRIFLAEVYMATDRKDLARQELEYVLKADPIKGYEPETAMEKIQAKKLLETL